MSEPYFNEAGYERQKGTQQGCENSRMYNEMVVLKLVQAMTRLALNPPEAFKDYVLQHFQSNAKRYFWFLKNWKRSNSDFIHFLGWLKESIIGDKFPWQPWIAPQVPLPRMTSPLKAQSLLCRLVKKCRNSHLCQLPKDFACL